MTLLSIRNLEVQFKHYEGVTKALKKISLDIKEGEKVALVGESGSGKSVTARMILGLLSNSLEELNQLSNFPLQSSHSSLYLIIGVN